MILHSEQRSRGSTQSQTSLCERLLGVVPSRLGDRFAQVANSDKEKLIIAGLVPGHQGFQCGARLG